MTQPLPTYTPHYGSSRFSDYVENHYLLVDKTLFVKHFLQSPASIALISRPRRWGKTLNLSLLEYFFSIPVDAQGNRDLIALEKKRQVFSPFKIGKETALLDKALGKYPVVFITLKGAKGDTYEEVMAQITAILGDTYKTHRYLLESSKITPEEKEKFKTYLNRTAPLLELPDSLRFLMELLFLHFGQRSMLLIDEYDTPFNLQFANQILRDHQNSPLSTETKEAQDQGLKKLLHFFQLFLGASLKVNEAYLERGVVTGILRIAKANLFSDVNNLGEFSILNADDFSEDFGFSEEEISGLLNQWWAATPEKLTQKVEWMRGAKAWYNGYQVGSLLTVYNPWSIINWLGHSGRLSSYWSRTSKDTLIRIALSGLHLETTFQKLLAQEWCEVPICSTIALEDFALPRRRTSLVWTLLTSAGYLTVRPKADSPKEFTQEEGAYEVKIPNREIIHLFRSLFLEEIALSPHWTENQYIQWIQELIAGNVEGFCQQMKAGLRETASFYHTRETLENVTETFYHGLGLGMMCILRDSFIVESERESGTGRLDLILIGKPGVSVGYVFELKAGKTGESLESLSQEGLSQIRKKDYTRKFGNYPHITTVYETSIAFCGKEMDYSSQLMGTTTQDDIRELAGEYFEEDWDEMIQKMAHMTQQAIQKGDFKSVKNLSDRIEKLQRLKKKNP